MNQSISNPLANFQPDNLHGGMDKALKRMAEYLIQLQNIEKDLYKSLRNNPEMDNSEKEAIVNKINGLSDKREALNEEIKALGEKAKRDMTVDFQTFQQQMRIVNAAEEQLNESKMKLRLLNDEKLNKLRLVQINTYYNKRYDALGDMLKQFILFVVIAIIFAIIMQKGFIPANIGTVILTIYVAVAAVYFWLYYLDIAARSKRNFDEYEWIFDPNRETNEDSENSEDSSKWLGNPKKKPDECVGEDCCTDGMKYDESLQQCITEEGMANALTQNVFSSRNTTLDYVNNTESSVQGFSNSTDNFATF
tara:strand:+ start:188 stop:1108 length:921 start_codon:yes stop_codon:yes gene_type:complete